VKQSFTLFFLFLIGYSFVGYFVQLDVMLLIHKQQMLEAAEAKVNREVIVIPLAEFKKQSGEAELNEEKEFRYKGELYDISEIIQKGNLIYIYCFNDQQEERLLTELDSNYNKDMSGSQNNKENNWMKDFLKDYFCVTQLTTLLTNESTVQFSDLNSILPQFIRVINCPPPKTSLS
jgi:hypothetical protein